MVSQYPDIVTITRQPAYVQDANGTMNTTGTPEIFTSDCRAEKAGKNPVINTVDGQALSYAFIVYMPKTSEIFSFGDEVSVTKADGSVITGTIKDSSNGQFNTRVWV